MGNTRDIKRRIKSVANTTKITRTMELIPTAQPQQCQARIQKALPYFHALAEIAGEARKASSDDEGQHPLLERRDVKRVAILAVVAYDAVLTFVILKVIDAMIGLRVGDDQETEGLDLAQHDERAYTL